jgi:NADH-quinone oxidoreductase subunit L
MSQIGYMMLAAGIGPAGYAFAIFHLLTHGFFKADLFLGAGSVKHAMDDEVDMRFYGALRRLMVVTFVTFTAGYLSIIGFPGFAGFWSKDRIIEVAFAQGWVYGVGATLGAGLTGFYMTRVMLMTFFGDRRWKEDVHPHESPAVMTIPLWVLAAGSTFGGVLLLGDWIVDWLAPVVGNETNEALPIPALGISAIVLIVVAVGAAIAWATYGTRPVPTVAPATVSPVTTLARRDIYGDALNETVFMRPGQYLTRSLVFFDNRGVDGGVNGLAALVGGTSGRVRRWQTGFVRSYALSMLGGSALVVIALLAVRLG